MSGTFGLAFIGALFPLVEALYVSDSSSLTATYGRFLRMFLAAVSAVGMLWTVLSPCNGSKLKHLVSEKMRRKWEKVHAPFAGFFVVAIVSYSIAIAVDHCSGSHSCGPTEYAGVSLALAGGTGMLVFGVRVRERMRYALRHP